MNTTERSNRRVAGAPKRRKSTDAPAYHEMMTRLVRRNGERAGSDTGELTLLADVARQVDAAMIGAVRQLRANGVTWQEIADAMGRSKGHVHRQYAPLIVDLSEYSAAN